MDTMYYVYKIQNLVNNKFYIGVHNGKNPNYFGSGKALKQAIKKYGKESFEKRILFKTEHEGQAYKLERLIVTENFIKRKDTYNLKIGGIGGRNKSSYTDEERKQKSEYMKKNNPAFNFTNEWRNNQSKSKIGKPSNAKGNFKKPNDGKWEGTAHKGKDNPRAKVIYIFNNCDDIIYKCHGTFYKTLEENDMPVKYFRKTLKDGPYKPKFKELGQYTGWYAKEMKDAD